MADITFKLMIITTIFNVTFITASVPFNIDSELMTAFIGLTTITSCVPLYLHTAWCAITRKPIS